MKQLDLLPPDFHRLRRRRRWVGRVSIMMMIFAVAAGLLSLAWEMQQVHLSSQHRQMAGDRTDLAKLATDAAAIEQRYQALTKQVKEVDDLVPTVPFTAAISLVCHSLPESVSLYGVVIETQPREAESPDPKDKKRGGRAEPETDRTIRLTISGHARDDVQIARFVSALGSSELLSKVQLGTSRQLEVHGASMHEFQVTAEIAPNLKLVHDAGEVASGS